MNKTLPIITTYSRCRHNPGDTFIGEGLRYVAELAAGCPLPWQILSKFRPEQWEEAIPDMARSPITLYAGTPQYNNYSKWKFDYDDELWSRVINPNEIPVAVMAGGSGEPDPHVTPEEWAKELCDDEATVRIINQRMQFAKLFTVRDRHSKALLDRLGIESTLLPCTAIFAGDYAGIVHAPIKGRIAVVPNKHEEPEVSGWWLTLAQLLKDQGYDPVFVCHERVEFDALQRTETTIPVYYTNDYYALLRFYGTCDGIISARLHGALPAWGIGVTHALNLTLDSRGYAVEECGIENAILNDSEPRDIADRFAEIVSTLGQRGDDRLRIRSATAMSYAELLRPLLANWQQYGDITTCLG